MLLLDLLPTYRYSDPQGSESTKRAVVLATVCTSEGQLVRDLSMY